MLFDEREKKWGRTRERKAAEIRERNWIFFSSTYFCTMKFYLYMH